MFARIEKHIDCKICDLKMKEFLSVNPFTMLGESVNPFMAKMMASNQSLLRDFALLVPNIEK